MWPNPPQGNQPPYPGNPGYPPQQQAPSYPPSPYYPSSQVPGQAPYPTGGGYPQNPGYPPSAGQPYGGAPTGYPQPAGFAVSSAPGYPPTGSPYPPAGSQYPPVGSPYPPTAPGSSPYPAPGSSPYPAPGSTYPVTAPTAASPYQTQGYPNLDQSAAATGFQGSGYPQQNQYGSPYPAQPVGQYPAQQQLTSSTVSHNFSGVGSHPAKAMQQYQEIPTIREGHFDPTSDAQILRKAMKGIGTDEAAIINILGKRTNAQRQQISQAFKTGFGKDLVKDLKSELGGKLEQVVLALITPKYEYLAQTLHKAMSGIGTKENVLVDILCTATNSDIQWLNSTYQRLYNRSIEQDIKGDTSGHFERLLVSMTTGGRNEDLVANPNIAAEDAQKLLQAGEKKWGTDESTFNLILATRSFAQLRLMFHEYERITGHSFEKAINKEFSGDVRTGMLAVVKSASNRAAYFAERLHQSLAGMGTKDNDLIFIVTTRAEIDLESIKNEYQRMYGKTLLADVSGDTSGDYKKILLVLMGN